MTEVDAQGAAVKGGYTSTKNNAADGTVTFDQITYSEAGTHYYKVTEDAGQLGGVTYSNQSYTITVTVSDNGDGTLTASADQQLNNLVFTNTYAAAGTYTPAVKKVLNGRDLKSGEFSFTVTEVDAQGAAVKGGYTSTKSNAADGTVTFDEITYSEAGVHYYKVTEDAGQLGGVTYSTQSYTITVTVSDNENGTLTASVDQQLNDLVFTNTYAAAGSTNLTATKNLTGREFKKGDNWNFTVTAEPADAPMPEHTTLTTSAESGNTEALDFGKINYTLEDAGKTYVYTITESGNVSGVINDVVSTRTVSITAHDNGDGTLRFDKVIQKNGTTVDKAEFTNTYETTSVSGTKSWSDADNQDGIRPNKIKINLLADGVKVNSQEVRPDANGNWTYSFTDLQK